MAGNGCHLAVLKVWFSHKIVHGIQSTYTSMDGKHFTSIRHASPKVSDYDDDLHEKVITLKHDEFIKYASVSATNLLHNVTIVTSSGTRYSCGTMAHDTEVIQYKPPPNCGILAFYGTVCVKGMSSLGCYVIPNE